MVRVAATSWAPSRSASVRSASAIVADDRSAPLRLARGSLALVRVAATSWAPSRSASVRLASEIVADDRSEPLRLARCSDARHIAALRRVACCRLAPSTVARGIWVPTSTADSRLAPVRSTSSAVAPERSARERSAARNDACLLEVGAHPGQHGVAEQRPVDPGPVHAGAAEVDVGHVEPAHVHPGQVALAVEQLHHLDRVKPLVGIAAQLAELAELVVPAHGDRAQHW